MESDSDVSVLSFKARKRLRKRASRIKHDKKRKVSSIAKTVLLPEIQVDAPSSSATFMLHRSECDLRSSPQKLLRFPSPITLDREAVCETGHSSGNTLNDSFDHLCVDGTDSTDSSHDSSTSCAGSSISSSTLWDDLRKTALETKMTHRQVNRILADLKRHGIGPLPKDCRTLKRTSYDFRDAVRNVSGMKYYYFGLETQIRVTLRRYSEAVLSSVGVIEIVDNIDGLPLYKSTSLSAWPVLAMIKNLHPCLVFCVVLTIGSGKPENLDFLHEYVDEINRLSSDGLHFNGIHYDFKIVAHVCDAPARSMVKGTKSFHSHHGCDFCETIGVHDGKRMTWPCTRNLTERSNESFRSRRQELHHKCRSPFESTQCNMIMDFPIDFMHQGTGVILKLMKWNILPSATKGTRRLSRMSASNIKIMNSRLLALRKCVPDCFARRPRSTKDLLRYKATELRQLLLYTARIVMKGLMATDAHFVHLCGLSFACSLLVDKRTVGTETQKATDLLQQFCEQAKDLYGPSFMVYNVHCLLHLPAVANVHGSLDSISAYCFENFLGQLKRGVRSPLNPIVSAVKFVHEMQESDKSELKTTKNDIRTRYPNNCYVDISRNLCYEAVKVMSHSILVRQFRGSPFLLKPIPSDIVGCFIVRTDKFKYISLHPDVFLSIRRGMKIDLAIMEGLEQPNSAVFMAMLHDNHTA